MNQSSNITSKPAAADTRGGRTILSPDQLADVGRLLYGRQWQTPLAEALGISSRSMRYLAAGNRRFHEGFAKDLAEILGTKLEVIAELAASLQKRLD